MASIKRIIADDPAPGALSQSPPSQPAASRVSPVLQPRTAPASYSASAAPPPWPKRAEPRPPDSVLELTDRMPEPPPMQRAADRIRQAEAEMAQSAPRPVPRDLLPRTPAPRGAGGDVTLDALVREMLEPMLADWIERNLPEMVERIVQAEIRRMTERDS